MRTHVGIGLILSGMLAAAAGGLAQEGATNCDPGNGGITLPEGFCASVFADKLGAARHMAVSPTGDVYVALRRSPTATSQGVLALRDADKNGKAEIVERLPLVVTTGIEWRNNYLYYSDNSSVSRVQMKPGQLLPVGAPEVIVSGLTDRRQHADKPFTFDEAGNLYVNIGAPSNTCQQDDRKAGSPGQKPCPILQEAGGIWRFNADTPGQTQKDGHRYATGIRNAVAIAYNPTDKQVYVAQHGRDALDTLFPHGFTARQNAELPAEELFRLSDGADFGWPYCYFDIEQQKKVLSPEYGGDGKTAGECDKKGQPLVTFPAHNGPNDVVFYTARQFPAKYRNGAFVALHGSWNRAPFAMDGYKVVFVPFDAKGPTGSWEAFADGFPGKAEIKGPRDATYRPTGLAVGVNGELYISDDAQGRVWRVTVK
jgi:glucose/arabinose dehydrogenase